jgi:hypothetical protein
LDCPLRGEDEDGLRRACLYRSNATSIIFSALGIRMTSC